MIQLSTAQQKKQIRKEMRLRRKQLTKSQQQQAAINLFQNLNQLKAFRQCQHLSFYFPNSGEIDTSLAMRKAIEAGKKCYLPILNKATIPRLYFAPVDLSTKFKPDYFGIPEPVVHPNKWIKPMQLDAVFMPLVAFALNGQRIGMGGGFYDASFGFLTLRKFLKRPFLIGIAHDLQKVDHGIMQLLREEWDVPLNAVVTDKQIYTIK